MPAGNADERLNTGPDHGGESDNVESLRKKQEKKTGPVRDLRYQQDLIDQFINSKPTIPKQQDAEQKDVGSQVDLTLETPELEGDVVSETLARIFVKQGKLEKARDIYKKLIWKYPQKKAYFAAQIKDLKG
jgi:hypothetical protein